ncbi:hypothetical protein CKM354_000665300 [Cercospora kikuchii]|uniref:Arylsulfotransferase n=1 Tax=Cercospora kikuchii TaxID=84275 RepID=A0A9P3FIF9_9PEZI|nr:uncharacterized protein CKM354_000665300 [Cercospora kikuchii]GIZ43425.1 hypothetical protein CKM354_000665300 [Cercospora kikuchii]
MDGPTVTHPFKSRPDIAVPHLNVTILDRSTVSPGYIFISPFKNHISGPFIYDQFGELIWSGSETFSASTGSGPQAYVFEPCPYSSQAGDQDETYLCMLHTFNQGGSGRGQALILDSAYKNVKGIQYNGTSSALDLHEFKLVENGSGESQSALLTQYRPIPAELSAYGVPGIGWLHDSVFQEQRLSDGAIIFEWKASDHINLNETAVAFYDGRQPDSPWDYFHINSVQKLDGSGDYLISARHASAIYLIDGKNGSVVWRLGGRRSDFRMISATTNGQGEGEEISDWFYFPHHATLLRNESGILTISPFDNGQTPKRKPRSYSRGLLLSVNEAARTVSILETYRTASQPRAAELGGSMQILENGNVLIGWGNTGCMTEYTAAPESRPVFEACVVDKKATPALYRATKTKAWIGRPKTRPAVAAFSRRKEMTEEQSVKTAIHMSWNGATEVASWRIYGGSITITTPNDAEVSWTELGTFPRSGFETSALIESTSSLPPPLVVKVEALAADGNVLGESDMSATFVPNSAAGCNEMWCRPLPQRMKEVSLSSDSASSGNGSHRREAWQDTFMSWQVLGFALCALIMGVLAKRRIWRRNGLSW